jgi:hypothetical protein
MQKSLGIASPLFGERTLDRGAFTNRGNAISGRPASGPQKTPVGTLCFLYYHHLSALSAFSA